MHFSYLKFLVWASIYMFSRCFKFCMLWSDLKFSFPRGLTEGNRYVHDKFIRQLPINLLLTRLTYGLLLQKIGVKLEKKFATSILSWLKYDTTVWDDAKKGAAAHFFFIFFIFFTYENIVTLHSWCKLREIRVCVKRKKIRQKKMYKKVTATPIPTPPIKFSLSLRRAVFVWRFKHALDAFE